MENNSTRVPSLSEIKAAHKHLRNYVRETPIRIFNGADLSNDFLEFKELVMKLELFQLGGSFKVRGAFSVMLSLTPEERLRGVIAMTAGNHGVAVSLGAKVLGISAKIVMPETADPMRISLCREFGAEVELKESMKTVFERVQELVTKENRYLVHPFDGFHTTLGTATLGLEFFEQTGPLDAVIVPIGGGGLASGVGLAFNLLQPGCKVYGVEPFGSDVVYRSVQSGKPERLEKSQSIADSLCAPLALPYSLSICRSYLDSIVRVTEDEIQSATRILFERAKILAEPASATTLAALRGPLHDELIGKRVGLIISGGNISLHRLSVLPS